MPDHERDAAAAEDLVAFLKAVAVIIATLDDPNRVGLSAHGFMKRLNLLVDDPELPGETATRLRTLCDLLGKYVSKAVDVGTVARQIEEAFRETLDDDGAGGS